MIRMITVFMLMASLAAAQTAVDVSGRVEEGSTITIVGSDFGNKPRPGPVVWESWEDIGAASETVFDSLTSVHGWELRNDYRPEIVFSDQDSYGAGTMSVRSLHPQSYEGSDYSLAHPISVPVNGHFYFSFRMRTELPPPDGASDGDENLRIWKFMRLLCVKYDQPTSYPSLRIFGTAPGNDPGYRWDQAGGDGFSYSSASRGWSQPDEWNAFEGEIWAGEPDARNGRLRGGMNGFLADRSNISFVDTGYENGAWEPGNDIYTWITLDGGVHEDLAGGPYATFFDAIYMDDTLARVVIGDAADYASCTVREPQICTNWQPGVITATVNQGEFVNGQTVWLYVVDADGNIGPAKQVRIGDETDPGDLGPPGVAGNLTRVGG